MVLRAGEERAGGGDEQSAPTCPRDYPATGGYSQISALSFYLSAGPRERAQSRDDKLFQVSLGKQGRERLLG